MIFCSLTSSSCKPGKNSQVSSSSEFTFSLGVIIFQRRPAHAQLSAKANALSMTVTASAGQYIACTVVDVANVILGVHPIQALPLLWNS